MKQRMSDLWRPGRGMEVEDLGDKLYLFQFHHINNLRWVTDRGPWTYDNALFMLHELKPGETLAAVMLLIQRFRFRFIILLPSSVRRGWKESWVIT
ncbi:hypothetical protein LINGRAHAP2_LOCUS1751 [Linum grandiflorum]